MKPNARLAIFYATFIATFLGHNYTMDKQDIETYIETSPEQNHTIVTSQDYDNFRNTFIATFKKQNPTITMQETKAFVNKYNAAYNETVYTGEFRDQANYMKLVHFSID
jgi:hypothetical protein